VKIQFVFLNDENRFLLQAATDKSGLPVGEVSFRPGIICLNFVPLAAFLASGQMPLVFHFADSHGKITLNPRNPSLF
jgi:hypothetical protein